MRLGFDARAVDQNAGVGRQARKRQHDAVVQRRDLAHGAGVLQARGRLFLDACLGFCWFGGVWVCVG